MDLEVDKVLEAIGLKALEKRAPDRYPTAKELLDALEHWSPTTEQPSARRKTASSEPSKNVLGLASPVNDRLGQDLAQKAFTARLDGRLAEAADLMEEAFNKSPSLREKYQKQVRLWRCGISM